MLIGYLYVFKYSATDTVSGSLVTTAWHIKLQMEEMTSRYGRQGEVVMNILNKQLMRANKDSPQEQ